MNNRTKFGIVALVTAFLLSLLTRFWSPYLLAQNSSPVGTWTLASRTHGFIKINNINIREKFKIMEESLKTNGRES